MFYSFFSPFFLAAVVFGLLLQISTESSIWAGGGCGFNERAEQHYAVNVVEIILL